MEWGNNPNTWGIAIGVLVGVGTFIFYTIVEHLPPEQGLKQNPFRFLRCALCPRRESSIRTRIEAAPAAKRRSATRSWTPTALSRVRG